MRNENPRYPNPTITEAVCDIHFRLPSSRVWKPSLPGELFKLIQNEYPEIEPVLEMGLQFEVGPSGTGTKILPQSQKVRFRHKTRPLVLQLAETAFSVSVLPPYPGWEIMQADVLSAWRQVEEILKPEIIQRIGLRYINRLEKETRHDLPTNWLVATEYIPSGVLLSKPGFLLRLQTYLDTTNMLIVTLGDIKPEVASEYGAIIFDIDRIVEQAMIPDQDVLGQVMDRLHTDVWNVFSSAKGEKLNTLLNKKGRSQL